MIRLTKARVEVVENRKERCLPAELRVVCADEADGGWERQHKHGDPIQLSEQIVVRDRRKRLCRLQNVRDVIFNLGKDDGRGILDEGRGSLARVDGRHGMGNWGERHRPSPNLYSNRNPKKAILWGPSELSQVAGEILRYSPPQYTIPSDNQAPTLSQSLCELVDWASLAQGFRIHGLGRVAQSNPSIEASHIAYNREDLESTGPF
jgi:hypothetical protein